MPDLLEPVELLAKKEAGENADINRWDVELDYALVPVGKKPAEEYAKYAQAELHKGISAIHIIGCGLKLAKVQQVVASLIESGTANVFRQSVTQDANREADTMPGFVVTMVRASLLPETNRAVWNPEWIDRAHDMLGAYRSALRVRRLERVASKAEERTNSTKESDPDST